MIDCPKRGEIYLINLPLKPSVAKCEQVTTLDKSFLVKGPFAGKISEKKLKEIEEAAKIAIGIL